MLGGAFGGPAAHLYLHQRVTMDFSIYAVSGASR